MSRIRDIVRPYRWILLLAVLAGGGCNTGGQPMTVQQVLSDMSPGFETVARSHHQRLIRQARAVDINTRQLVNDLDSIFLTYRPLRLTPYPIP